MLLEDLYRPYRPKRRTRATIAKEKGLEGLANIMWLQMTDKPMEEEAADYVAPEKEVNTAEEALQGAKDILAEAVADEADYRTAIRKTTMDQGLLVSKAKDPEEKTVYENYYDFDSPLKKISGYQVLAINRGEKEKVLTVKIEAPEEDILRYLTKKVITRENEHTTPYLQEVLEDSYKRLIAPAIEREIRSDLTENAEDGAIRVFGKNPDSASDAAAYCRKSCPGLGSGLSYGLQAAVSIARRLQDPLAELVKIDPKSIGVGQYQHDMNQKKLSEALGNVVEDCVNSVGVDLNTASASLLEYVSGISKAIAKNIVAYREENGQFQSKP